MRMDLVVKKIASELRKKTTMQPTREEIVEQAGILCKEYISNKLKRLGILDKDLGSHIPSLIITTTTSDASEEFQEVGAELESMYPELYTDVFKHLNISVLSEDILRRAYTLFAEHLCKGGLHWGKIVALFAMVGAFAEDCVHMGHPEYVSKLVDTFVSFVSKRLAKWIAIQGGWALPNVMHNPHSKNDHAQLWLMGAVGAMVGFVATLILTISM